MSTPRDTWLTGLYRSGVLVGIGAVLWMQTHFVSRGESKMQWAAHDELRDNLLVEVRTGIRDAKDAIQRVEIKLDEILRSARAGATSTNKARTL